MIFVTTTHPVYFGDRAFMWGGRVTLEHTFTFELWTTNKDANGMQGSYWTTLPISPLEYRRQHPDWYRGDPAKLRGCVLRHSFATDVGPTIVLVDDWATEHQLSMEEECISQLLEECERLELLVQ